MSMTFLVEILHHVQALLVSRFKPTWVVLTATAALYVAWAVLHDWIAGRRYAKIAHGYFPEKHNLRFSE
jgi:hypothetical protein